MLTVSFDFSRSFVCIVYCHSHIHQPFPNTFQCNHSSFMLNHIASSGSQVGFVYPLAYWLFVYSCDLVFLNHVHFVIFFLVNIIDCFNLALCNFVICFNLVLVSWTEFVTIDYFSSWFLLLSNRLVCRGRFSNISLFLFSLIFIHWQFFQAYVVLSNCHQYNLLE